tara:strand:- start:460 stop:1173 length:714 start_codon:yes stop_codon:yes gene_type:complete
MYVVSELPLNEIQIIFEKLQLPEPLMSFIGGEGGLNLTTVEGILNTDMFTVFAPLISIGFAIYYGFNSTFKEEEKKYIDIILSTRITRESFLIQKALSMIFKNFIISYSLFFSIIISTFFFNLTVNLWNIFSVCFYLFLLSSVFGTMTTFTSTIFKKGSFVYGIPSATAIVSYIIYSIEPLINSFKEIKFISFFYFYKGHDPLNNGFHEWYWIIFILVGFLFIILSIYFWNLRDIDT